VTAKQGVFKNLVPIGVSIGSGMSSRFARFSRRVAFVAFNVLGILGCLLSCVNTYITVILGRFIYGFAGGVMLSYTPKML
jgi:predicted MFS family arabinose efflux permease